MSLFTKMRRAKLIGLILGIAVAAGTGVFFLVGFLTYGTIQSSGSRYYAPLIARSPEPILIRTDIGNINVKYNTSAMQQVMKVDYDITMSGIYMIGKSISSFFLLEWDNVTSQPTEKTSFVLSIKPGVILDPTNWFSLKRITIDVTLRTDIIYQIEEYATTGNINNEIPTGVNIYDLTLETTTGNSVTTLEEASIGSILADATTGGLSIYGKKSNFSSINAESTTGLLRLNFSNCFLNGDITGEATTGRLTFNSYNARCSSAVSWDLTTTTGNLYSDIFQYVDMGSNIDGIWTTTTGNIYLDYIDGLPTIGATFSGSTTTGNFNPIDSGGFDTPTFTTFRTLDYLTANYTFDLDLHTTTGNININGQSS
ncbi:MAG: hypothetical protein ACFFDY_09235 [Candidatus Thorarchaeota archaeon]